MAVAVVGAFWHTPLDDVGSILLSVGVVTAGAAILGPLPARRRVCDGCARPGARKGLSGGQA